MRELWKKEFRMSAETIQILVDKVSLRMQKQDTRHRNAIVVHRSCNSSQAVSNW